MDEIHQIAKEIAEDGFQWQKDGQKVLQIAGQVGSQYKTISNDDLTEYLTELLKSLDREYDWDLPGRTQVQEDQLYGMFARLYVSTRNVG